MEDCVIVQGILDKDEDIIQKFYTDNYRMIVAVCKRYLRNIEDAEDMAQESFLCIFKNIHKFHFKSKLSTWIYRIVCNNCLMKLRKDKNREKRWTPVDGDILQNPEFEGMIIDFEDQRNPFFVDLTIDIEKAINQLPKGYKEALLNHDFFGFDHEQVAKMMGVSIGTSKSQLHKARTKFKKLFDKKENPRLYISA